LVAQADTACRRTEALFQLGAVALAGNPATARRHWEKLVESGAPALIEYAAARMNWPGWIVDSRRGSNVFRHPLRP